MKQRFVVIMAGGKGERFWPQSRLRRPKQLLPIVGDQPMLGQTIDRLPGLVPLENIFVLTNREQRDAVVEVCPQLPAKNIVAEPVGRDTAAAVGLATLLVKQRDPNAVFAMLPADHVIHNHDRFQSVLAAAFDAAEADSVLVTVGIKPNEPATGFGYIHRGDVVKTVRSREIFSVREFVEKPNLETAKTYLDSGDYFWNAGMFVWSVGAIDSAFKALEPELAAGLGQIEKAIGRGKDLNEVLGEFFPSLKKISVDYAIMEKAGNVVTLAADFDWDDVGAWPAIARHMTPDGQGNVVRGSGVIENGNNNIVVSSGDHLVTLVGVDDLVVVHTAEATLVCPKGEAQRIKGLVKRLGADEKYRKLL